MGLLYSKMKIFYYLDKVQSLPKDQEIIAPIQVRIKPTNVCAHNCWYCAYRAENLQLGQEMKKTDHIPKEKMLEIVDDLIRMSVKSVTFSGGGDPFHYPYLVDTIKHLANSISFAALTNGSLLKGEVAELFALHGTWIRVSMDGWDNESYSAYRGVRHGEYGLIIENMRNFKRLAGKCLLGVSIVVDEKNYKHVFQMIEMLKSVGVDSVKVAPCLVSNVGRENNAYHANLFNVVKEQIARAIEMFNSDDFEIFDSYHEQLETFNKKYDWCPYLQIVPVIGADLNVYACHDKAYNQTGVLGSIKEQSFEEFWFKDKGNYFNINPSVHCNHHCVVHSKNELLLDYLGVDIEHLAFV